MVDEMDCIANRQIQKVLDLTSRYEARGDHIENEKQIGTKGGMVLQRISSKLVQVQEEEGERYARSNSSTSQIFASDLPDIAMDGASIK
eukprot:scaffold7077_cov122-Skeletonema_dohrnii-CCMP3373.AAC.5